MSKVETTKTSKEIDKVKQRFYIQFYKKVRTVYINGKTVSDLEAILDLMLNNTKWTIKSGPNKNFSYNLGDLIYLIDIRYNTFFKSKKQQKQYDIELNPEQWFQPEHLKKIFKPKEHIRYRYCKALGNPPKIRKDHKDDPDRQKELYLQYLKSNHKNLPTRNDFDRLYAIASNSDPHFQVALMCYCEPEKGACHRFWLKEALAKEYRDRHGLGDGPNLSHYILNTFEKQLNQEKGA